MSVIFINPYRFGVPWTPANITTALWLDAADASTVTTVSGAVSQWNDKSGNGRNATQPTAGRRPLYQNAALNGRNVLSFDGSDDVLGFVNQNLGRNVGALSYFAAFISNAPTTSDYRALFDLNTNPGPDRASFYLRSSTLESGGRRLDADSYQFHQSGSLTTSASVASILFDYTAATLGVSLNGASLSFRSGGFQTAGNTSNTDSTYISIGGDNNSVDAFTTNASGACNCTIAEFICLQSAPSTDIRQRIEGYLAHKWGLTASLPADHPYKSAAPTAYAMIDADAAAYVARVEGASGDNQALENDVRKAIDDFVIGCKADGIWNAIKASCILAGARTLAGALQPLVGTAPTNFNFVSGDYNRKTGLVGNGSTKYLNSNFNDSSTGQDNVHVSAYQTTAQTSGGTFLLGLRNATSPFNATQINTNSSAQAQITGAIHGNLGLSPVLGLSSLITFAGYSRNTANSFTGRAIGATTTFTETSVAPVNRTYFIFAGNNGSGSPLLPTTARLAFYSIGESLNLALLDTRVTALINAYAAAIP